MKGRHEGCQTNTNAVLLLFFCVHVSGEYSFKPVRSRHKQARYFLSSLSALRHGRRPMPCRLLLPANSMESALIALRYRFDFQISTNYIL